jgi:hypothetical protein
VTDGGTRSLDGLNADAAGHDVVLSAAYPAATERMGPSNIARGKRLTMFHSLRRKV